MKHHFQFPIFSWLFSESHTALSILQGKRSCKILIPLPNERHPQLLTSISSQTTHHHPEMQGLQGLFNPKAKQNIPFVPVYQAIHVISIRNLSSATDPSLIWLYYIFFEKELRMQDNQELNLARCHKDRVFDGSSVCCSWLWHSKKSKMSPKIWTGLLTASKHIHAF